MPVEQLKNFGRSRLATGINGADTSIVVTAGDGAKLPAKFFYVTLVEGSKREALWVASRAGDVLNVTGGRGRLQTSPESFTTDAVVLHGPLAHHTEQAEFHAALSVLRWSL